MTFTMKTISTAALAVATIAAGWSGAQAQVGSRTGEAQRTRVRFDRPVQIPGGQILPPGTYVFTRVDVDAARDNAVQILAEDGTREVAKVMTNDARRNLPTSGTYFEFVDPAGGAGSMGASGTGSATTSGGTTGTTSGSVHGSGTTGTTSGSVHGSGTVDTTGTTGTTGGTASGSGDTGRDTMGGSGSGSGTGTGTTGSTTGNTTGSATGSTTGSTTTTTTTATTGTTTGGTGSTRSTGTGTASMSATSPLILKAWYFPGTTDGQEFVYPDNPQVADRGQRVLMQVGPDYSLKPVTDASTTGEASTPGHTSTEDKNKDQNR